MEEKKEKTFQEKLNELDIKNNEIKEKISNLKKEIATLIEKKNYLRPMSLNAIRGIIH